MSMTYLVLRRKVISRDYGWKSPSNNTVKLNIDGASKDHNMTESGGVIRDMRGDWLKGFFKFLRNCSAIVVGFWGVLKGLKLAKRLGLRRVEMNVDYELVVRTIQEESRSIPNCLALIREIMILINEHEIITISHTFRYANALAKISSITKFFKIYANILEVFVVLLEVD